MSKQLKLQGVRGRRMRLMRIALGSALLLGGAACSPSQRALDQAQANCADGNYDACQAVPVLETQVEVQQQQLQNDFSALSAAAAAWGRPHYGPPGFYSPAPAASPSMCEGQ
jgi:hypothetical protein